MKFWMFMLICNLIIPLMMIIFGRVMWKHPPKKINGIYGYRTNMSMKNMDTWTFAHEYCGKLWWKIGWIMLLITILVYLVFVDSSGTVNEMLLSLPCLVQTVVLVATIFPIEKALRRTFDENGNRRE